MIIIGEKLNSSIPKTLEALNNHNEKFLIDIIKEQAEWGADYLDINTALTGEKEIENMLWLISLTLKHSQCNLMLDSPQPEALISCINNTGGRKVIINSITLDDKFNTLISAANEHDTGLVCLPMTSGHIPQSAAERVENAKKIIQKLLGIGFKEDKIYIDLLLEAIATNQNAARTCLETQELIKNQLPGIKTICGLSNVSFGLPNRADINSVFLAMAVSKGLDSAIINITSAKNRKTLAISNAILGNDEYCIDYINFCRL